MAGILSFAPPVILRTPRVCFLSENRPLGPQMQLEIQRTLPRGAENFVSANLGKAMTNIDSILRSRDITLPTKVGMSKLWFFQ